MAYTNAVREPSGWFKCVSKGVQWRLTERQRHVD
jgi:hypothetical protein